MKTYRVYFAQIPVLLDADQVHRLVSQNVIVKCADPHATEHYHLLAEAGERAAMTGQPLDFTSHQPERLDEVKGAVDALLERARGGSHG